MTDLTRDQHLLEEFKEGLDKDGPVVLARRVAELEEQNKALTAAAAGDDEDLQREKSRAEAAERDRDEAIARADKAEGSAKRAKASLTKATTPAKPRRLVLAGHDQALQGDALRQAIADAEDVEIAFSDGEREIPGIAPIAVEGDAWRDHMSGLMLAEPVDIEGPDGHASVAIAGYVLLLDGKAVAWSERSTPLPVAPRGRLRIQDDIIF